MTTIIPMKRAYTRRSDEERIAELQSKIESLQQKMQEKERPDSAILRELPRIQRRLNQFAQRCSDFGRPDLSNSIIAFLAGLERAAQDDTVQPRRGRRSKDE